jgi:transcriptional regulator with XRE-family HTH domain
MGRRESGDDLFPALLRHWRSRRGLSQLDLSSLSGVSSRHISFLETGRSVPSADMVLRLAAALDVPLRHVNAMLRAAGHRPRYREEAGDGPVPEAVRGVLDLIKAHHEPYPLLVLDAAYRVRDANDAATRLLAQVVPGYAGDGTDLVALLVDPDRGPALVVNHAEVVHELLRRLQRELLADPGDEAVRAVLDDVLRRHGPGPAVRLDAAAAELEEPLPASLPLRLRAGAGELAFVLTVTTFQTPLDVALQGLRIESWYPADDATARACAAAAG